jgi:predicted DNA-binding transcriptional regulator AlpA
MKALPETLELVGIAEIAEMAGTRKSAVINWRKDHENFPKPVVILRAGPIFWKSQVETWLDARQNNPKFQRYIMRQKNEGTRYPKGEFVGPPKPIAIFKGQQTEEERLRQLHEKIERDHQEMM